MFSLYIPSEKQTTEKKQSRGFKLCCSSKKHVLSSGNNRKLCGPAFGSIVETFGIFVETVGGFVETVGGGGHSWKLCGNSRKHSRNSRMLLWNGPKYNWD